MDVCMCVYFLRHDDNDDDDRKATDKRILISLLLCAIRLVTETVTGIFCCMAMDIKMFILYKNHINNILVKVCFRIILRITRT